MAMSQHLPTLNMFPCVRSVTGGEFRKGAVLYQIHIKSPGKAIGRPTDVSACDEFWKSSNGKLWGALHIWARLAVCVHQPIRLTTHFRLRAVLLRVHFHDMKEKQEEKPSKTMATQTGGLLQYCHARRFCLPYIN